MKKYFIANVITSICSVLILKVYTNFLTMNEFGMYALLQSFFVVISSVFSKFLSQSIYKFYKEYSSKGELNILFISLKKYIILIILIISTVYILLFYLFREEILSQNIYLVYLITIMTLLVDIQNAYYQSSNKVNSFFYSELFRNVLKVILPVIFYLYFDKEFKALLSGYLIALILTIIPQYYKFLNYDYNKIILDKDSKIINTSKVLLKYSASISIWYLLIQFTNYADRILLLNYYGDFTLAKYAANFSIFSFASQIISLPIINSVHSKLLKYNINNEKSELELKLNEYTSIYVYSQFILIGILCFYYKEITLIVLNKNYILNPWEIFCLIIGYSFWTLGNFGNKVFETTNSTHLMLLCIIICVIIYFPLLLILRKLIGEQAIFLSKSIMYFSYPFVQIIVSKNFVTDPIKWKPKITTTLLLFSVWFLLYLVINHMQISIGFDEISMVILKFFLIAMISLISIKKFNISKYYIRSKLLVNILGKTKMHI